MENASWLQTGRPVIVLYATYDRHRLGVDMFSMFVASALIALATARPLGWFAHKRRICLSVDAITPHS
jgi:hypothetical protein